MPKLAHVALLLLVLSSIVACGDSDGSDVTVRVVSDLVAGAEVSSAEIDLLNGSDTTRPIAAQIETRLIYELPLTRGRTIGTFRNVANGTHAIHVVLKSRDGRVLGRRPVVFEVTGNLVVTVHITADCATVVCPGSGNASLTACLSGTCVDPRCTSETPEFCEPSVICEQTSDCTSAFSCSTAECVSNVCIETPIENACEDDEYCAREDGCAPIDGEVETPDTVCGKICQPEDACFFGYYECSTETPICMPFLAKPECNVTSDAGVDADVDANVDSDANIDSDANVDADVDASIDAAAQDAGMDANLDTGIDASLDTGVDADVDASVDAGIDATVDAAEPVECDPGEVEFEGACLNFEQGVLETTVEYGDDFGASTIDERLAISADGNTLVVGAPYNASAGRGVGADETTIDGQRYGAAYVFEREGDVWALGTVLKASNADEWDAFGTGVSISDDGSTIAVGAPGDASGSNGVNGDESDNSVADTGAVYVFDRTGDSWAQTAYLKASNSNVNSGAEYGRFVALSADGNTLGVGSPFEMSVTPGINQDELTLGGSSGAVYVFVRDDLGEWTQEAHIKASNAEANDVFGFRLAFSASGDVLAVSALEEFSCFGSDPADNSCARAGAAYVFVRDDLGEWSEETYLKAGFPSANDRFGKTLAISADGKTLVVGTPFEDSVAASIDGEENDDTGTDIGASYVFVRDDDGVWTREAYLKPSNPIGAGYFGSSVSISSDGSLIAVGSRGERSDSFGINGERNTLAPGAGAIYLFERDGVTWSEGAFVKASFLAGNVGLAVVLARDATTLAAASTSGVLVFEPLVAWSEVP